MFQAMRLKHLYKVAPDLEIFKELHRASDLALRAAKMTAQSIGCTMGSLIELNKHLFLTLTDMNNAENAVFLNVPVSL